MKIALLQTTIRNDILAEAGTQIQFNSQGSAIDFPSETE